MSSVNSKELGVVNYTVHSGSECVLKLYNLYMLPLPPSLCLTAMPPCSRGLGFRVIQEGPLWFMVSSIVNVLRWHNESGTEVLHFSLFFFTLKGHVLDRSIHVFLCIDTIA